MASTSDYLLARNLRQTDGCARNQPDWTRLAEGLDRGVSAGSSIDLSQWRRLNTI